MHMPDFYITTASIIVAGIIAVIVFIDVLRAPKSGFRRLVMAIGSFTILIGLSELIHNLIGIYDLSYQYKLLEFAFIFAAFIVLALAARNAMIFSQQIGFRNSDFDKNLEH